MNKQCSNETRIDAIEQRLETAERWIQSIDTYTQEQNESR
jgi:hypothetical protein